ncbi:neuraminidase-like domain-containing protein [Pseudomonas haemolytica]|uniref:Insecticidal toxin complex protein TcaB1 n=1 Tax=Pseudomonas haemolytica TaxID=2600065 RepID=A0A5P1D9S1_9PSED|nr:neuraminidase-like domain-containing protein [Pseudomonas haemolytica]MBJ2245345.1 insecticidal toxin protein [Pseudomonas haemolytica]MBJ2272707.1 insecticidal toxin protein [Pseudomonas haemolytica]MBK3447017.1 insecticidal toxin protein [Pseudomonas haemolytica]MBK3458513.1 insecticidal toxin protein [Pseudomonas haemolytica]MRJ37172.1 insecticidal toxin complex protein TcaB1 [Pseudomonas haemolytica]
MSEPLDQRLNEAWRDAMLSYYLSHCISPALKDSLRTPNDLYDYWLLDVQVSQAVPTSPVASAITSLQHYINRIHSGLEPGYETQGMSPHETLAWQTSLHTYPLWSASQQLRYHPQNFLDPTLREDKSESFEQLENELNQHRIQPATAQNAVQGYLSRFEEVASIQTLNGYIDGNIEQWSTSTYYFVGKSATDELYYWRSLDLSKRSSVKAEAPAPLAWTDWKPINLTFSADTPAHGIRPVMFNHRLFIVWAESIKPAPSQSFKAQRNGNGSNGDDDDDEKQRQGEWLNGRFVKFRLCFSYKKLDGTWSLPHTGLEEHCVTRGINALTPAQLISITQTVAVVDNRAPHTLFLGIRANTLNHGSDQMGEFFQAISVDQSLGIKIVASAGSPGQYKIVPGSDVAQEAIRLLEAYESTQNTPLQVALLGGVDQGNVFSSVLLPPFAHQYFRLFFDINKDNLQFKTRVTQAQDKRTVTVAAQQLDIELQRAWDFESRSKHIKAADTATTIFDPITNEFVFTSKTTDNFLQTYSITLASQHSEFSITLVTRSALHDPTLSEVELINGSIIRIDCAIHPVGNATYHSMFFKNPRTGKSFSNAIYDKNSILLSLVGQTISMPDLRLGQQGQVKPVTEYSLEGKFLNKNAFLHLYTHHQDPFLTILDRYSGYTLPSDEAANKKLHFVNDLRLESTHTSAPTLRFYKHVIMQSKLADVPTPQVINNNTARILNFTDIEHESLAGTSPELAAGHLASARITLPTKQPASTITLIHGVITLESQENKVNVLGYALKAVKCALGTSPAVDTPAYSPRITRQQQKTGETVESIDFSSSFGPKIPAIRLNTSVARKLTQTLNFEPSFLRSPTDWTEPALVADASPVPLDFQGAHGKSLRELFIYLPWTLAYYFNQQQQYAHAETWLHYLFDPRQPNAGALSSLPSESAELSYACQHPESPHYLALSFPTYLRKALHYLNVDILLNRGDAAYRQSSPDSLAEAKLWYMQAQNLLGPRPTATRADTWTSRTLETLAKTSSSAIRQLEHQADYTKRLSQQCKNTGQRTWLTDSPYLYRPLNTQRVARWDTLESRLHGLRHHLDIAGKPLRQTLFAPPLSPAALLARNAQSTAGGASALPPVRPEVGHYRFQVMQGHALSAVDSLAQFGNTLLTLIERKEQAHYLEVQQQNAWQLAELVLTQQTQALAIDEKNKDALRRSRAIVQGRLDFLTRQLSEGISPGEISAGQHYLESAAWERKVALAGMGAGAAMLVPNIFGTSFGGMRFEGAFHAYQAFAQGEANIARANGSDLERTEQFNRRAQEWTHAEQQAHLELAQIDALLLAHAEQEKATRLQLRSAHTALAQAKSAYQLLGMRFTGAQLYQWLTAQLSTFYYALYDSVHSLCLAAEACWQYETADSRQFFQGEAWHHTSQGLLSAEGLKLNLVKMNTAYLQHTPRELEISKTVSLRHRLIECSVTTEAQSSQTTKTWAEHKTALVSSGTIGFALSHELLNEDYPGHTLRRIKHVSVSLPATLGPYEDIKATLTQTRNEIQMPDGTTKTDLRAHQQIALSRGLDDDGLFTLNFDNDPRYLPFEYTGAVSCWSLNFTNPLHQKNLLESITDIIIHVRYTARPGRSEA